jgi:hypothetical protein
MLFYGDLLNYISESACSIWLFPTKAKVSYLEDNQSEELTDESQMLTPGAPNPCTRKRASDGRLTYLTELISASEDLSK